MSILPSNTQNQQLTSSSTSFQNPNSINHGGSSSSSLQHHQQEEATTTHDLEIIGNSPSGSLPPASHHSGPSSKKVNKTLWKPRGGGGGGGGDGRSGGNETSSRVVVTPPSSTSGQGSAKHSGSGAARKSQMVSGNHLLNFHYDPISRQQNRGARAPPPQRRQPKRKPYNKDLFLQANYKFVVLDTGDYTPETMDPDKMLRWEDIICFKYLSPVPVHCPVCLGDPLCPQITSCGHIFCFPCIMQYFLIDQNDHKRECWKKCPLCFTMISSQDLYTIKIQTVKQHSVGDIIDFILLTRKKDSYTLSLKNNEEVLDFFSKFILTSDVELSVREAMSDLDSWLARADSGLVDDLEKLPYVCAAMEQLEKRKKYWNEHRVLDVNKFGSPQNVKAVKEIVRVSNDRNKINGKSHMVQTGADQKEDHDGSSSSSYDDIIITQIDGPKEEIDKESYNFYQANDGQLIIMSSINMRCLLHHYGTSDKLPSRINGKILQLENVSQSETTRKRYKYLSHFSLTTSFQLCEIDLREVLPADSLSPFMDEIKNREKLRKQIARKEQQEKMRAEAVGLDLEPLPYYVTQSSSFDEPPSFSIDDFEALGSSNVTSSSSSAFGGRQLFSSVTRLGFAAGHDSPSPQPPLSSEIDRSGGGMNGSGSSRSSFASITSRAKPEEERKVNESSSSGKKGKKGTRVLLSTAGGRRY